MALTDAQCKKVVTRIWGYYKTPQGWFVVDDKIDTLNYARDEKYWIRSKVNSWEGIGKTLETIASKNIIIRDFAKYYPNFDDRGDTADFDREVVLETSQVNCGSKAKT